MKKYFVARVYSSRMTPTIEFNTDSKEDAEAYADIMQRNEEEEFIVYFCPAIFYTFLRFFTMQICTFLRFSARILLKNIRILIILSLFKQNQ